MKQQYANTNHFWKMIIFTVTMVYINCQNCFYSQNFNIFPGSTSPVPYLSQGYTFPLTWNSSQTSFTNYSFFLVGFKLQSPGKVLTYEAKILNISSTGANFYFKFYSHSQIVYGQFGIIMLRPCSRMIRLIHFQLNPTVLSIQVRTLDSENTKVYVDFTFGTPSNYVTSVFLSAFKVENKFSPYPRQILWLTQLAIVAGNNYHEIQLISSSSTQNAFSKIQFTYIVFDRTYFIPYLSYFKSVGTSTCSGSTPCLTAPANFQPLTNNNCIIGLNQIITNFVSASNVEVKITPSGLTSSDIVYYVNSLNFVSFKHCIFCLAPCLQTHLVYYTAAPTSFYTCILCGLTNCKTCETPTLCFACKPGFTYYPNKTCSICLNDCLTCNSSTTCLTCKLGLGSPVVGGCTTLPYCIEVDPGNTQFNRCKKCSNSSNHQAVTGLCSNTQGCSVAISNSSGIAVCIGCNSLLNFNSTAFNGSCSCASGYLFVNSSFSTRCLKCPQNCQRCYFFNTFLVCSYCQPRYYVVSISQAINDNNNFCRPCLADCLICSNNTACITCLNGTLVKGGCTTIEYCQQVIQNSFQVNQCLQCAHIGDVYQLKGFCIDVIGCLTPNVEGNKVICSVCNFMTFYQPAPVNGTCICKKGFVHKGGKCLDKCGDGKQLDSECDDGNTQNLDGCSSECKVQPNFKCQKDSPTVPSRCVYLKQNVRLKLISIDKVFLQDRGIFTFEITPLLFLYKRFNLSNFIKFQCNQTSQISSIKFQIPKLIIQISYKQDLQGNPATVILNLPLTNFIQTQYILNFNMISDGVQLIILHDRSKYEAFMYTFHSISISIIIIFGISLMTHKMIGLQILRLYQIIYLLFTVNKYRTPFFSVISFLANASYNYMHFTDHSWNVRTPRNSIYFNEYNQSLTTLIILGSIILPILGLLILLVIRSLIQNNSSDDKKNKRFIIFCKLVRLYYNRLVFPLIMSSLLVLYLLFITRQQIKSEYSNILNIFAIIVVSSIYFYQWKILFTDKIAKDKGFQGIQGIQGCDRCYIPLFLTSDLINTSLLTVYFYGMEISIQCWLLITVSITLVIVLWYRPYRSIIHNIGIIINYSCQLLFICWIILRDNDEQYLKEESQIFWLFILLVGLVSTVLITLIRLCLLVKELFCQRQKEGNVTKVEKNMQRQQQIEKKSNDNLKFLYFQKKYLQSYKVSFQELQKNQGQIPDKYFQKGPIQKQTISLALRNFLLSKTIKKQMNSQ